MLTVFFFFFNDTATTEIYTLSLHDALPIYAKKKALPAGSHPKRTLVKSGKLVSSPVKEMFSKKTTSSSARMPSILSTPDRKSTRLNSSHANISYAVFCLKKKKKTDTIIHIY